MSNDSPTAAPRLSIEKLGNKPSPGEPGEAPAPKGTVPAVMRAVQLLDLLAAAGEPLSLAEATQRLGLPKSSVLGLLATLTHAGVLQRTAHGTYELGAKLLDWTQSYLKGSDLTQEFVRATEDLARLQGEGVVLAVLDGADTVYVACRHGTRPLGVTYRIGMRLPAACTASGKALLSTLSDDALRGLYGGRALPRLTAHSHRTLAELLHDLAAVRRQGYAVDREETREGMVCLGAPIFDGTHPQAVAAVAVSTLAIQPTGRLDELAAAVSELAERLSRRLGGGSRGG